MYDDEFREPPGFVFRSDTYTLWGKVHASSQRRLIVATAVASFAGLTACGGSGGNNTDTPKTEKSAAAPAKPVNAEPVVDTGTFTEDQAAVIGDYSFTDESKPALRDTFDEGMAGTC